MQLPEGFISRLRMEERLDADQLIRALAGSPAVGVRLNPAKDGVVPLWLEGATAVPWSRNGYYLDSRPDFTLTPALHAGGVYVQDPASMVHEEIVARLTQEGTPVRMLDLCAAPGGKTTAAIASLPEGSLVVANEVVPNRASILAENLTKWGYPHTVVTSAGADAFGAMPEAFDMMIVDAPCSGEGMMRKEPKAVEQWSPGLVESCARLQREILSDALGALRCGGYLIYSTCTFSRDENESMVEWMMDEYGMESVDLGLESLGVAPGWSQRAHTWRFMPHLTRGEGLFVSVLRKPGQPTAAKGGKRKKRAAGVVDVRKLPHLAARQEEYAGVKVGEKVHLIHSNHLDVYEALRARNIRMLGAGIEVGEEQRRGDIIPAHSLAMSTALAADAFPTVALDEAMALDYLRRENIHLPEGTPRGFVIVTHAGYRLGFMKNIGTRANNLYPSAWRIRTK